MLRDLLHAELLTPAALWVLLPFSALLIVLALFCVRNQRRREARSLFLRLGILLLLALAWADPVKKESESSEQLLALIDVSASVPDEALQAFAEKLGAFTASQRDLKISLYPFAKSVQREPILFDSDISSAELVEELRERAPSLDRGETDLGSALQYAASMAPGGAALLLSDGYETTGNARETARTFGATGGRIYPLIPTEEPFRKQALELSMLTAPITSKAGDLIDIRLTARNTTSKIADGVVELYVGDKAILNQRLSVSPAEEKLLVGKSPALEGGLHKVRAILSTGRGVKQELHRWVSVRNKARLLLISGAADDERVLKQLLTLKGYSLQAVVADGNQPVPKNFEEMSGIIFNNVSAQQLPSGYLSQVKNFAERGGGVLLIGGDKSFGLGNYMNTPLEEISPVKFVPPRTAKKRLVKAIAIVIDKSKSMAYDGKMEGARDAAMMAIRNLPDEDYITVIGFDAAAFVVIRIGTAGQVRPDAAYRLSNLVAQGRTDLLPGLVEARRALAKAPADRKHIIVLSDGKIPIQGDEYIQELSRLRQSGITLSGVALGDDADAPFMQMLAQYGRGAFYQTLSSSRLPEIFLQDIKVATGERTMKERADFPVGIGPAGITSTTIDRFPSVRGFVETLPKRGANIELITKGDEQVSPLLASWKFGAGKVIAYTSDANGRWSLPWLNWEGFTRFWSQLVEEVEHAPDENASQVDFDLRSSVNRKTLFLDLSIYDDKLRTSAAPKITAEVTLPGGEKRNISFLPERKGRFRGAVDGARPGDYRVQVLYGSQKLPVMGITLDGSAFGESPGRGINRESLAELASVTGGAVNPEPHQVARATKITERAEHLYPPLAILAFFLFLLEVFMRELGLGALVPKLRRALSGIMPGGGGPAGSTARPRFRRAS